MKLFKFIYKIITYDELSLFQISFTYIFVIILNPNILGEILSISFQSFSTVLLFLSLGLPFIFGIIFSVKHIFLKKKHTKRELWLMISSSTIINLIVSYYTLKYGETEHLLYLIFPIINIVQAAFTLWFLGLMSKDDEIITLFFMEGNVKRQDAIINLLLLTFFMLFFHYYLRTEWYYTISSAITWNVIVSKFLKSAKQY